MIFLPFRFPNFIYRVEFSLMLGHICLSNALKNASPTEKEKKKSYETIAMHFYGYNLELNLRNVTLF